MHQTDEYKASNFPGMNESDNAKVTGACEFAHSVCSVKDQTEQVSSTVPKMPRNEYQSHILHTLCGSMAAVN